MNFLLTFSILLFTDFCKSRRLDVAWELLHKLYHKGLAPDVVTYSILIRPLCKEGRMEKATDLLLSMEENGCAPDVVTFNTLMNGFLKKE